MRRVICILVLLACAACRTGTTEQEVQQRAYPVSPQSGVTVMETRSTRPTRPPLPTPAGTFVEFIYYPTPTPTDHQAAMVYCGCNCAADYPPRMRWSAVSICRVGGGMFVGACDPNTADYYVGWGCSYGPECQEGPQGEGRCQNLWEQHKVLEAQMQAVRRLADCNGRR